MEAEKTYHDFDWFLSSISTVIVIAIEVLTEDMSDIIQVINK